MNSLIPQFPLEGRQINLGILSWGTRDKIFSGHFYFSAQLSGTGPPSLAGASVPAALSSFSILLFSIWIFSFLSSSCIHSLWSSMSASSSLAQAHTLLAGLGTQLLLLLTPADLVQMCWLSLGYRNSAKRTSARPDRFPPPICLLLHSLINSCRFIFPYFNSSTVSTAAISCSPCSTAWRYK